MVCMRKSMSRRVRTKDLPGEVYSDIACSSPKVHDERPGAFANPIIATLVTGGARLKLALLESEVAKRGGTYAFCDMDSLAIIRDDRCPEGIPSLPESAIAEIVAQFDALNPYYREIVPHLLRSSIPSFLISDALPCRRNDTSSIAGGRAIGSKSSKHPKAHWEQSSADQNENRRRSSPNGFGFRF